MAEKLITQVQEEGRKPQSRWSFFCCKCRPAKAVRGYGLNVKSHSDYAVAPQRAPPSPDASRQPSQSPVKTTQATKVTPSLLGTFKHGDENKKTLVLDLDETLVHSSFKPVQNSDFTVDIELESVVYKVFVSKRPGVDFFLQQVAQKFEVVVFTASLAKYADPVIDLLDPTGLIGARLFRDSCVFHYGNYVKDLTHLGRNINTTIIVDNSPFSYMFQPENAIPIRSWFSDITDRDLLQLLPLLDTLLVAPDVVPVLRMQNFTELQLNV